MVSFLADVVLHGHALEIAGIALDIAVFALEFAVVALEIAGITLEVASIAEAATSLSLIAFWWPDPRSQNRLWTIRYVLDGPLDSFEVAEYILHLNTNGRWRSR